jgi:hypothetical protein
MLARVRIDGDRRVAARSGSDSLLLGVTWTAPGLDDTIPRRFPLVA